jgi:hypothetical protein
VLIAGEALGLGEASSGEYLDAIANGEDPLSLRIEFANKLE